jgi:glyceraldehyde-3-phosphate dehydrogenase (NADP+) (phosphorylating)
MQVSGPKSSHSVMQYDSILGTFDADIKVVGDDAISVDGKVIKIVSNRDPTKLPWG